MFENNSKGWHGSYSVVGRISAEKFHIILMKNDILQEKKRKKKVNSFLFPSDSFEKKNKPKEHEEEVDIFEESQNETDTKKEKDIFSKKIKKINSDIYNSHYLHHKEIEKQINKIKEHQNLYISSMKYNPKMNLIWKRVISGPKWNTISGRERINTINYKPKSVGLNHKILKNIKQKKNLKNINLKKSKNKKFESKKDIYPSLMNTIIMNKQTARGDLPTYYDHRIRNVKPFIIKNLKKSNKNDNKIKKPKNIKNNLRISLSTDNNSNYLFHSNSTKIYCSSSKKFQKNNNKSLKHSLSPDMKGINFSKTISRDQLNFIYRDREGVRPFFIPNYKYVEPRSLSMVSYTKKYYNKFNTKRLSGLDPNLFVDSIQIFNKYNNYHHNTNGPNFKLMVSRGIDKCPLPSYMINKFDRNSLDSITEKGLRMNCYLNSKFNKKFSTFYPKKSFNRLINNNYLQEEKFSEDCLNYLVKECFSDKKLRKYIEYYNKDVNYYLEQNSLKRNFDGVTFSTYKDNVKKFKDKEFYEKCFHDRYNGFC